MHQFNQMTHGEMVLWTKAKVDIALFRAFQVVRYQVQFPNSELRYAHRHRKSGLFMPQGGFNALSFGNLSLQRSGLLLQQGDPPQAIISISLVGIAFRRDYVGMLRTYLHQRYPVLFSVKGVERVRAEK